MAEFKDADKLISEHQLVDTITDMLPKNMKFSLAVVNYKNEPTVEIFT